MKKKKIQEKDVRLGLSPIFRLQFAFYLDYATSTMYVGYEMRI